ncbi:uncharacterized protein LOC121303695 [Polyodon spathula]|uniref:uncharacterized protein LOC121303695 n=1 Tax=Polyodon spathula TaxID=7913 RepID=UPI001B7F1591|nr:uncharacterized protein LOC121303695 [Polyodon spathula]
MDQKKAGCFLLCGFLLAQDFKVCSSNVSSPDSPGVNEITPELSYGAEVQRAKRSGTTLVFGAIEITKIALRVAEAMKGNCIYYPRICQNKRIIQNLEKEESDQREQLYSRAQEFFKEIRELWSLYFNLDIIYTDLKDKIDMSFKSFDAAFLWMAIRPLYLKGKVNLTDSQIEELVSVFPSDAEKMFSQDRQTVFKELGINFFANVFLCVPYKKIVHFLKHTPLPEYFKAGGTLSIDKVTGNLVKLDSTQYLEGDYIFIPAKFSDIYQLYKHASNYSTNSVFSSSNTLPVRFSDIAEIHERSRAKFQSSLQVVRDSLDVSLEVFNKSNSFWTDRTVSAENAILRRSQAHKIDKELENLKNSYILFQEQLKTALRNITELKTEFNSTWEGAINMFKTLTEFVEELKKTSKDIKFWGKDRNNEAVSEILSLHFENTSATNIIQKQEELIAFLAKQKSSFNEAFLKNTQRILIYQEVGKALEKGREVDIINDLVNRELKTPVDKKTILCEIALQLQDDTYDYYDLRVFRPHCSDSVSIAEEERKRTDWKTRENKIEIILQNCELFDMCLPMERIVHFTGMTEAQVKAAIKRQGRTEYLNEPL